MTDPQRPDDAEFVEAALQKLTDHLAAMTEVIENIHTLVHDYILACNTIKRLEARIAQLEHELALDIQGASRDTDAKEDPRTH